MKKLVAGIQQFQKTVFPDKHALFSKLATGQNPDVLFITCADSRIDPVMITQTVPGELFICRNAGNIVPPHRTSTGGMTASIEYAVSVLNVKHIIICGHSDCGAMGAAAHPETLTDLPHVENWLDNSRSAVYAVDARCECGDINPTEQEKTRLLTEENIFQQLQHLRTHPAVAARLATNRIQLHGWYYNIGTGEVFYGKEDTREFVSIHDYPLNN